MPQQDRIAHAGVNVIAGGRTAWTIIARVAEAEREACAVRTVLVTRKRDGMLYDTVPRIQPRLRDAVHH